MSWFRFGDARLEKESNEVIGLAHELRDRMAEYERTSDPFQALIVTAAINNYEDRQERNIWRGTPT